MNYQHIYHSGNFADIFKHSILIICLKEILAQKKPFIVIDSHAGAGKYDLLTQNNLSNFEARDGIIKIALDIRRSNLKNPIIPTELIAIFNKINLDKISEQTLIELEKGEFAKIKENDYARLYYPGSPLIISHFTHLPNNAVFIEKDKKQFELLRKNFAGNKKIKTICGCGFSAIKSLEIQSKIADFKNGLIIIDPPFEKLHHKISPDYQNIVDNLDFFRKKSNNITYIIWYPIIDRDSKILEKFILNIKKIGFKNIYNYQINIDKKYLKSSNSMQSCGIIVINGSDKAINNCDIFTKNINNFYNYNISNFK